MAFSTPSLNDFVRTAENGLASAFYGEGSVLRKGVLKVLARVFAGVAFMLVLLLRSMWRNLFLTSSDVEGLVNAGTDFSLPNKPESYARGKVIVKADSVSTTITQGTVLTTEDGVEFEAVSDTVLAGGSEGTPVSFLAVESGESGNIPEGTVLEFRDGSPDGVDPEPVVGDGGFFGGVSYEVVVNGGVERWGETVENYRSRLLEYRRNQPCGGCVSDYKSWAERFAGVSRCIVNQNYPHAGGVRCVLCHFDDQLVGESVEVGEAVVQDVEDYVTSDERRPVTAAVTVVSCKDKELDFTICIEPNNNNIRASVRSALKNVLRSYSPGDTVRTEALSVKLLESSNAEKLAVFAISGGQYAVLDMDDAEMPIIGEIDWRDYNA